MPKEKSKPTKWTKMLYNKFVASMHEGLEDIKADDPETNIENVVCEIANDLILSEKCCGILDEEFPALGLTTFMKANGIKDVQGRLADDIYSGRGFRI